MADELFEKLQPINIRYRPHVGKAQDQRTLPLKLLVVGDFSVGNNTLPLSGRKALEVNQDNFDQRLASQNIKMELSVPNRLSNEEGARLPVALEIKRLKDFDPDQVVEQVPALQKLLQMRRVLERMKMQFINEEEFRKNLAKLVNDPEAARAFVHALEDRKNG